mgnify:FL=1
MASSLIQIRIDEELKAEATALYEALGIDLPTAVRMFIKRSVLIQGIPFSMNLPSNEYKAYRSVQAIQELSEEALKNGVADMTIEEINEEISAARNDRDSLGGTTI